MPAKDKVVGNAVDDDGLTALPDFVTDGGFDLQFPARRQPECDLVAHRAANPSLLGDAGDRGKAHAGRAADNFENARNRRDALHRGNIRVEVDRHDQPSDWSPPKR